MKKYDPLGGHLRRGKLAEVELSFDDIERLLGAMLPKSASHSEWWGNNPHPPPNHAQCQAWIDAGYTAQLLGRQRVRFCRISSSRT